MIIFTHELMLLYVYMSRAYKTEQNPNINKRNEIKNTVHLYLNSHSDGAFSSIVTSNKASGVNKLTAFDAHLSKVKQEKKRKEEKKKDKR